MKPAILYIGNKLAVHGRTPGNIDTLGPLLQQEGYTMYYSSARLNRFARLGDMLYSIIKHRNKVDVVLIDTFSTAAFYFAWLCGLLCTALKIKYIPILRGGNLPERMKQSPGKCRQLFGNSQRNITVSGYLHAQLANIGYDSVLIENHIELDKYSFKQRDVLKPVLLWVRAFHTTYNPQLAVEVLRLLAAEHAGAEMYMVGPGVDGTMQQCKELALQYHLLQKIAFTGKLSKQEWAMLAHQTDVFVNTANFDNLPVSVIEAMALGLPVVSTNVGGIPYLVQDGVNGLLVPPGDSVAMNAAIQQLLDNPQLAGQLSINARKTAEQYDWKLLKQKWHNLFKDIQAA